MLLAVPAIVDMKPEGINTCPTNSGNVYVSAGCNVLALVIKLALPAVSPPVTKFTLIVAAEAL